MPARPRPAGMGPNDTIASNPAAATSSTPTSVSKGAVRRRPLALICGVASCSPAPVHRAIAAQLTLLQFRTVTAATRGSAAMHYVVPPESPSPNATSPGVRFSHVFVRAEYLVQGFEWVAVPMA